jgi:hypothetical protein
MGLHRQGRARARPRARHRAVAVTRPPLPRAPPQLLEEARRLTGDPSDAGDSAARVDAQRLLAASGLNVESLERDVRSLEFKASLPPVDDLGPSDVDGYVAHHSQMVMCAAIAEAREATFGLCEELAGARARGEWEASKPLLLAAMGVRDVGSGGLGGAAAAPAAREAVDTTMVGGTPSRLAFSPAMGDSTFMSRGRGGGRGMPPPTPAAAVAAAAGAPPPLAYAGADAGSIVARGPRSDPSQLSDFMKEVRA